MKQFISILVVCFLAACSKPKSSHPVHASRITVIYDITDSLKSIPLPEPILSLHDFESDQGQAANFRMVLVTDKLLNPTEEIHIDDEISGERNNTNDEVDYRQSIVLAYYDAVRRAITDFDKHYTSGTSIKHSECFATIASELELLANSNASQKVLLIFSDLQENSGAFSCYTPQGQYLLQNNQEKVARLLLSRHSLPDNLQGTTIYFVYNPATREEDIRFAEMFRIYKQLLHARGARVIVQASNKSFQP